MIDSRLTKLAQVLVQYSLGLNEGQHLYIEAPVLAAPLVTEVYRQALRVGALPDYRLTDPLTDEWLLKYGSDAQIAYIPDAIHAIFERTDASLYILASDNTTALTRIDPSKIALREAARHHVIHRINTRSAAGNHRPCVTLYPTSAAAQDAEMSLTDYTDFVFQAGKLHHPDPVRAWQTARSEQHRLTELLSAYSSIRILAPDTDLTYHVAGRTWISAAGEQNFPDGEVFTGPHERETEGHIRFTYPAIYGGREVSDVHLEFRAGVVVQASATKGAELLHTLLDMDEGARRLGEVAFGTNEDIQAFRDVCQNNHPV